MRNYFNQLGPKTFQMMCILFCLIGDFCFAGYIYHIFSDKDAYLKNYQFLKEPLNQAFAKQGMSLPNGFEHEIFSIMIQSLLMMLFMFIVAHGLIYTFYYFQKRFAFLYIRFISLMGVIGAFVFTITVMGNSVLWGLTFLFVTVAYLFVIFGTYYFPINAASKSGQ
jgi:hypothetical protein